MSDIHSTTDIKGHSAYFDAWQRRDNQIGRDEYTARLMIASNPRYESHAKLIVQPGYSCGFKAWARQAAHRLGQEAFKKIAPKNASSPKPKKRASAKKKVARSKSSVTVKHIEAAHTELRRLQRVAATAWNRYSMALRSPSRKGVKGFYTRAQSAQRISQRQERRIYLLVKAYERKQRSGS